MICLAFDLPQDNAEVNFADVDKDAWYAPFVAAGVKNGIIKGISESEFGIKGYVTREDLCTMLYRMYNIPSEGEPEFTDSELISDYAKDAVVYMSQNGIVNGYGDNSFKPDKPCTRAEAAKVIYLLATENG